MLCLFLLTPSDLYPIKKFFQIGMPSFHPNSILFNIPGWTLSKTKICTDTQRDFTTERVSSTNHTTAIWAPKTYPALRKDLTEDEGLLSTVQKCLLRHQEKVSCWSWSHLFSPVSSRKAGRSHCLCPITLIIALACSVVHRLAGILSRTLEGRKGIIKFPEQCHLEARASAWDCPLP